MDKIQKALNKLPEDQRRSIKITLIRLERGDYRGLDLVKLKGHREIFRVRRGQFRIVFRLKGKDLSILAIERRSEKTYRGF